MKLRWCTCSTQCIYACCDRIFHYLSVFGHEICNSKLQLCYVCVKSGWFFVSYRYLVCRIQWYSYIYTESVFLVRSRAQSMLPPSGQDFSLLAARIYSRRWYYTIWTIGFKNPKSGTWIRIWRPVCTAAKSLPFFISCKICWKLCNIYQVHLYYTWLILQFSIISYHIFDSA